MKRSLPVILCVAAALVIALLVGNGFLALPASDGGRSLADATQTQREAAPRVDPEPLQVDYEGDDEDEESKKRRDKNANRKKKDDSARKKQGRRDPKRQKDGAIGPRSEPDVKDRNPEGKEKPANRKARKNGSGEKRPAPEGPAPASVTVTDLTGDPQGEGTAPGYMDLELVTLRQSTELMVAELTFSKRVPTAMPNGGVNMLTSIEVDRGGRKVSVYAEGSENGWRAHTNRSAEFPGSMEVAGKTIRFTLARSFFGNEFSWYAHSSWTKSTTVNTDYFFDFAPDDHNGRFPSGGTT